MTRKKRTAPVRRHDLPQGVLDDLFVELARLEGQLNEAAALVEHRKAELRMHEVRRDALLKACDALGIIPLRQVVAS